MFNRIMCFLIVCLGLPGLSGAQSVPLPVVDGWHVTKYPISITINDLTKAYVGFELKYQNPDDMNEFVMVIMRSTPVIVKRLSANDRTNITSVFVNFFGDKEEEELLEYLYNEKSDPIINIRWKVAKDPVNNLMVQDGDAMIWFQDYSGEWSVHSGGKIKIELMTGIADFTGDDNYSVGRKYSIDGKVHILKVDSTDLIAIVDKKKNKEKK